MQAPDRNALIDDIRAYLRQCDDQARLQAAFQRSTSLTIEVYCLRPSRPARTWLRLPRWLRRGK